MNEGTCVEKYTYIVVGVPVYSKLKCEYYSIYAGYYTNANVIIKVPTTCVMFNFIKILPKCKIRYKEKVVEPLRPIKDFPRKVLYCMVFNNFVLCKPGLGFCFPFCH